MDFIRFPQMLWASFRAFDQDMVQEGVNTISHEFTQGYGKDNGWILTYCVSDVSCRGNLLPIHPQYPRYMSDLVSGAADACSNYIVAGLWPVVIRSPPTWAWSCPQNPHSKHDVIEFVIVFFFGFLHSSPKKVKYHPRPPSAVLDLGIFSSRWGSGITGLTGLMLPCQVETIQCQRTYAAVSLVFWLYWLDIWGCDGPTEASKRDAWPVCRQHRCWKYAEFWWLRSAHWTSSVFSSKVQGALFQPCTFQAFTCLKLQYWPWWKTSSGRRLDPKHASNEAVCAQTPTATEFALQILLRKLPHGICHQHVMSSAWEALPVGFWDGLDIIWLLDTGPFTRVFRGGCLRIDHPFHDHPGLFVSPIWWNLMVYHEYPY